MHRDQRSERGLSSLDLLADECLRDEVHPRTAVLLRDDDPEQAELGHAVDCLRVEAMIDVVLDGIGQDTVVDEPPDRLLDLPLLVGEGEIHGPSVLTAMFDRDRPVTLS